MTRPRTGPGGRRRAVAYSPQDLERLARGEPPESAELDERRRSRDALAGRLGDTEGTGPEGPSNDERLLREVPPHWA